MSGLMSITTLIIMFSSGCTSVEKFLQESGAFNNKPAITNESVVIDVKFVPQHGANTCGIAVMEMLSGYYNKPIEATHLENLARVANTENGLTGFRIKEFLAGENYFSAIFPGTLNHEISGLYRHLDSRRPLIVMLGVKNRYPYHYVMVIGYNETQRIIVLLDPERGQSIVSEEYFIESWQNANRFMLVAYPNNKIISKEGL
jgi:ABC-type bacteriocin/lantibiotic exporter with double-glycine peptidase domain